MASIKDLKKRIVSTKSTQQTTKAMKMVSAAKLRRAQDAITSTRPYAKQIAVLTARLMNAMETRIDSPLLAPDSGDRIKASTRLLLVVVTSDRGLCAGFNSNIIRATQRFLVEQRGNYTSIHLSFLGKRGYDFFKTKKVSLAAYFNEAGGRVTFQKAKNVSAKIRADFLDGQFDEVKFIYNEFKNAASQRTLIEGFLPIRSQPDSPATAKVGSAPADSAGSRVLIVKPDAAAVLVALLDKHLITHIYRIMLESQAGEHGARMSAMENATKNAGEMIRRLTLQYNKQRQASITKELLEIISGSESSKSA